MNEPYNGSSEKNIFYCYKKFLFINARRETTYDMINEDKYIVCRMTMRCNYFNICLQVSK